jgi:hypothetical protein
LISCRYRSAVLLCNTSINDLDFEDESGANALEETIIGALLSQMIVDYLPPLEQAIAVRLRYDPITMSACVSRIGE